MFSHYSKCIAYDVRFWSKFYKQWLMLSLITVSRFFVCPFKLFHLTVFILFSIIPCQLIQTLTYCELNSLWHIILCKLVGYVLFCGEDCSRCWSTSKVSNKCSHTEIFILTNQNSSWGNMNILSHFLVVLFAGKTTRNTKCRHLLRVLFRIYSPFLCFFVFPRLFCLCLCFFLSSSLSLISYCAHLFTAFHF